MIRLLAAAIVQGPILLVCWPIAPHASCWHPSLPEICKCKGDRNRRLGCSYFAH